MLIYFGYKGLNAESLGESWLTKVASWMGRKFTYNTSLRYDNFVCKMSSFFSNDCSKLNKTPIVLDGHFEYDNVLYSMKNIDNLERGKDFFGFDWIRADGDFTLILNNNGTLEIVNDYYARRPFYYHIDADGNLFYSNDIRMLLINPTIPFEINRKACDIFSSAHYAINDAGLKNETFFSKIFKLLPGVKATFSKGQMEHSSYFSASQILDASYYDFSSATEYYEEYKRKLRKVLKNIVDANGNKGIGVSLSGGIDSANILAALIDLGLSKHISCYHCSSRNALMYQCSDHQIVKTTLSHCGVKGKIIYINSGTNINNCIIGRDWLHSADGPSTNGNNGFHYNLAALMQKDDIELLLGGDGGDYLFTGTKYAGDYLVSHKMKKEARERADYLATSNNFFSRLQSRARYNLIPRTPILSSIFYKKIFWDDDKGSGVPYYLSPRLKAIDKHYRTIGKNFSDSKILKNWYRRFIYDFMFPRASYDDASTDSIVSYQPLMQRSIFEFSFRTPPNISYDIYGGAQGSYPVQKTILRQAYKDILPVCITGQTTKTTYATSITATILNEKNNLANLFSHDCRILIAEMDIVDKVKFCDRIKIVLDLASDPHFLANQETRYLMNLINLEIWLQIVDKGRTYYLEQCRIIDKSTNAEIEEVD